MTIGTIYRPPNAPNSYDQQIMDLLEKLSSTYEHVILLGDLNVNCLNNDATNRNLINHLEDLYCFKQLVNEPTRVTPTGASLIDVILSTKPDFHIATEVIQISMSDHYCIQTTLKPPKIKNKDHKTILFRNYKNFDPECFVNDVIQSMPQDTRNDDLEGMWDTFKINFLRLSNKHAPLTTRRLKDRFNPWITHEIVEMMYERDHVKRKAVKHKCQTTWDQYRQLRNNVTSMIRKAKVQYLIQEGKACQGNPKAIWKFLNKVTGRKGFTAAPSDISPDEFN